MDVGLALPQYDYSSDADGGLPWATVVDSAERAEACGFNFHNDGLLRPVPLA
jgi:hypothetical protein